MKQAYLFKDMKTSEQFFVEAYNKTDAIIVAKTYFAEPRYLMTLDTDETVYFGYDIY